MSSYKIYRNTTLGLKLEESLRTLVDENKLNDATVSKILTLFDRSMNTAMANRVKSRVTFKAGKLSSYRFYDNVWTFILEDVEFREVHEVEKVDKVKIVACDAKGQGAISPGHSQE